MEGEASRRDVTASALALCGAVVVTGIAGYRLATGAADGIGQLAHGVALATGLVAVLAFGLIVRNHATGNGDVAVTFAWNGAIACLAASVVMTVAVPGTEKPWRWVFFAGGVLVSVGAVLLVTTAIGPVRRRLGLTTPE